ncbi:MAG: RNA-guided endonuclease InsQ/TnpB family protein [Candidatus Hermodarchaeota archaeon]
MKITEIIQVKKSKELSKLCHLAKNLYNLSNWYYRQEFFNLGNFLSYYDLDFILKHHRCYKNLPAQTSQQVLKLVVKNWKSYFRAKREWNMNKFKFKKVPKIPRYKRKDGESIVIFTNQNARIKDDGYLHFPKKCGLKPVKTRIKQLQQVRIIPLGDIYKIEIIHTREAKDLGLNKDAILGIDLGLNNLITAVNNKGLKPFIIKGGNVKSVNHYYNKQLARHRSIEGKKNNYVDTKKIRRLHLKRNNKIIDHFHKISKNMIKYSKENDIGTIVIGYNEGWKQKCNIGRVNNQKLVQIPFNKLYQQIAYKGTLIGINVVLIDESYTSKCSFLDGEEIKKQLMYAGKRIKRGLFKSHNGTIINADVNAGYNIMKKAFPNSITDDGIQGLVLNPEIVKIS